MANCTAFFGYPITPQNEVTEWFAREFPARGRAFVQAQSEIGSINMVYGAAAAGVRAMTSTSGPGWALMQESMAHLAASEIPCVVMLVQRGGPGMGHVRTGQMDYLSATRGGGNGGYKTIVLAPSSVQESHDLVQLAFHLADTYRNPAVVLTDGLTGQMAEVLEMGTLDFGSVPEKDWALRGRDHQPDGERRVLSTMPGVHRLPPYQSYVNYLKILGDKWAQVARSEVRYESYLLDDAELVIVAYGYASRVSKEAVGLARAAGMKVGLLRPITLWPFPYEAVSHKAADGCRFLVVEDSLGLMIEDVVMGTRDPSIVSLVGALAHHSPHDDGLIMPTAVFAEISRLLVGA